jgi:hypothetical protein
MSAIFQAVQLRCDWCQTVSEQIPLVASGIIAEDTLPEGWTSIGYGSLWSRVTLQDAMGGPIGHLCPACSARPAGELLTWAGKLPEKKAS